MRRFARLILTAAITGWVVYITRHWGYTSALSVVAATFTAVWFGFDVVFPRRRAWWRRGA